MIETKSWDFISFQSSFLQPSMSIQQLVSRRCELALTKLAHHTLCPFLQDLAEQVLWLCHDLFVLGLYLVRCFETRLLQKLGRCFDYRGCLCLNLAYAVVGALRANFFCFAAVVLHCLLVVYVGWMLGFGLNLRHIFQISDRGVGLVRYSLLWGVAFQELIAGEVNFDRLVLVALVAPLGVYLV